MALTVTPGGANDDSLISLADAKSYWNDNGFDYTTPAYTDAKMEESLRRATVWVEGTYRARWPGVKTNGRGQSRDWPRSSAADIDGTTIDSATVPAEIEGSVAEAAAFDLANTGKLHKTFTAAEQRVLTEVRGVKWTVTGEKGKGAYKITLQVVDDLLSGIVLGTKLTTGIMAV